MARPIAAADLQAIEDVVAASGAALSLREIERALSDPPPQRTLQYRLRSLVREGRLISEGEGRAVRYRIADARSGAPDRGGQAERDVVPLSAAALAIRADVSRPVAARRPVGYDRAFLDSYTPNKSFYLTEAERARLQEIGKPRIEGAEAGTYAKQIFNRLLIDLSWNSSRLEGNTYSLLDTRRLIAFGEEAEGHAHLEAQMILNHKDAIEFLVGNAGEIGFNRHTVLNLHGLLANNLLPDPDAPGRLRSMIVGIDGSVFAPLEVPALIEECFDQVLATAAAIEDPYEQALFVLVQLPYLQPFDDVNKRVSRLAANIPLVRENLAPLSFTDVPGDLYAKALLGIYELNRVDLFKDLFLWACERSAQRYAAVRQSLGEPDPFRLRYRDLLRETVNEAVRSAMTRKAAAELIDRKARESADEADREQFIDIAQNELLALHEGNFARYRITPAEFAEWRKVWGG